MAAATLSAVSHASKGTQLPRHDSHHKNKKPHKRGFWAHLIAWTWEWALLLVILIGGASLVFGLPKMGAETSGGAELAKQIQGLVTGQPMAERTDGVVVRLFKGREQMSVIAQHVTPKLCVSAAWTLAKSGTVVINGVTPSRVSGARLAELCNEEDVAEVIWSPKPE